jgi:two-component sensor histidine kinase
MQAFEPRPNCRGPEAKRHGKSAQLNVFAISELERKRSEAQIVHLAREAEHRTKNILATVQATVRLSHSNTSDDLKELIEGHNALAKVHTLFVQSHWRKLPAAIAASVSRSRAASNVTKYS